MQCVHDTDVAMHLQGRDRLLDAGQEWEYESWVNEVN